ncbi:MAG: trans-2-enoyl-CoA reductase family protein [Dehalococcoidia bacterium]
MVEQVVEPRIRGFISVTAHPEGCAANVRAQVEVAKQGLAGMPRLGPTLVVGSSTGYGLATLLSACFGLDAPVLGVCFERESSEEKLGTAGWYNLAEAHRLAQAEGRHLETVNGDAFSDEVKTQVIDALRERYGPIELLVYSLAAPRRTDPASGAVWHSVLKPVGADFHDKTVNLRTNEVEEASIEAATPEEIEGTRHVMGGEDWAEWVRRLQEAGLLAPGFRTVAYSYVGPVLTQAIYRHGTIGLAKEHLEATAGELTASLSDLDGHAWVSVNKAVVTQASAAIPAVGLYVSLLLKVMKERGTHEGTIEQIVRLLRTQVGPGVEPQPDDAGLIRLDDLELEPDVQAAVAEAWARVSTENLREISDYDGYQADFQRLFGFGVEGIDYSAPTEVHRPLV